MQTNGLHDAVISQHQSQAARAVETYWHTLARGGSAPRRSDIDTRVIQDALEYTFIGERLSGGHARFRVAGGALKSLMGMELSGMPLIALFGHNHRSDVILQMARVFDEPAKLTLSLHAPARSCQPMLDATLRVYPLRDTAGGVTQVIGTLVTSGQTGQTPRRFDVTSVQTETVQQSNLGQHVPSISRGYLRLVVSNT